MTTTAFSGPLSTFTQQADGTASGYSDQGYCVMSQFGTIEQNSTTAVDLTFYLPKGSQIVQIIPDVATAYDSATSATFTAGTASAGTQYVSGVSAKTGGRASPSYTAAQVTAMADIGTNTAVVCTVTVVGATTAGLVNVTILYVQQP